MSPCLPLQPFYDAVEVFIWQTRVFILASPEISEVSNDSSVVVECSLRVKVGFYRMEKKLQNWSCFYTIIIVSRRSRGMIKQGKRAFNGGVSTRSTNGDILFSSIHCIHTSTPKLSHVESRASSKEEEKVGAKEKEEEKV